MAFLLGRRMKRAVRRKVNMIYDRVDASVGALIGREPTLFGELAEVSESLRRLIDEHSVAIDGQTFAPHVMSVTFNHETYIKAESKILKAVEGEVFAIAHDYICDNFYKTFAPLRTEVNNPDLYGPTIHVEPSFGSVGRFLKRRQELNRDLVNDQFWQITPFPAGCFVIVRITFPDSIKEEVIKFERGGRRVSVGQSLSCDFCLNHSSVARVHATLWMSDDGVILISDAGSDNGTFLDSHRLSYGESYRLTKNSEVLFGKVKVRFNPVD